MNSYFLSAIVVLLSLVAIFMVALLWTGRKTLTAMRRAASLASRAAGIPVYRTSLPQIPAELSRARRYQRPLSVAVLRLADEQLPMTEPAGNGRGNGKSWATEWLPMQWMKPIVAGFPFMGYLLRDVLRESDVVTYDAALNQYVIALPDATREQAAYPVHRLEAAAEIRALTRLRVGLAQFPMDGLTLEDLVSFAQSQCENGSRRKPVPALSEAEAKRTRGAAASGEAT
jgi:hypothetical protein